MASGWHISEETRRKLRLARLGKHLSAEAKLKLSLLHKGKLMSEEARQHMSEAVKKRPPDVMRRFVYSALGKPSPFRGMTNRYTEETRQHISNTLKGRKLKPETIEKMKKSLKGRFCSEETRRKISIGNKEYVKAHPRSEEWRSKKSQSMKVLFADKNWREKQLKIMHETRPSIENEIVRRAKIGQSTKERWSNPEYKEKVVRAILDGSRTRPTRPETILDRLLQKYFPNQWVYNGDFSQNVMINGLIPDFVNINGKKEVIEVFGSYYHNPELRKGIKYVRTEKGRIERYGEFGFSCLVIWEKDLAKWRAVLRRIEQFAKV